MLNLSTIEAVILKCPYQNWHDPAVGRHFNDMIALKLQGYQKEYQYGVLPFDTTDFIANHIMIYEKLPNGEKRLISSLKSTPLHHCKPFQIEFNAITLLKHGSASQDHLLAVGEIIEKCIGSSKMIAYYSSWTILPEIRQSKENVKFLKDVITALTVLHHEDEKIEELLGLGVPMFKTNQYFNTWGFEPVTHNGAELPHLYIETYSDVEVIVMHLKEFSKHAQERSSYYRNFWSERKTVGQSLQLEQFNKLRKIA